jgi:hypothetical protein
MRALRSCFVVPVVLAIAACGEGGGGYSDACKRCTSPDAFDGTDAEPVPVEVVGQVAFAGVGPGPDVIYQDGDGPWQIVTADGDGNYRFTVTAGRYGFGQLCVDNGVQELIVRFATIADPWPELVARCGGSATPVTLVPASGSISGLTGGGYEGRSGRFFHASNTTGATASYNTVAIIGTSDYLFARKVPARDHVDRLEIVRDVVVEAGPVSYDLDLAVEGFATERRALELPLDAGDAGYAYGAFSTAAAGSVVMTSTETAPFALSIPPASAWRVGDRYTASAERSQGTAYQASGWSFDTYTAIPSPFVVELPGALIDPAVAVLAADPTRVRATSAIDRDAERYRLTLFAYLAGGCGGIGCLPYWELEATPAYVGDAGVAITTLPIARLVELDVWDARLDVRGLDVFVDFYARRSADGATLSAGILEPLSFPVGVARIDAQDRTPAQAATEHVARKRREMWTR